MSTRTLPVAGPTTLGLVKEHLGIASADSTDDAVLERVVAAVNRRVRSWPCSDPARLERPEGDAGNWDELPDVEHGATMLSARLWKRRSSPDGVAAFGSEGPLYVSRNDPDVALLLGLGQHSRPAVG